MDRMIQRLNGQREMITSLQRCKLEGAIAEAEEQGEVVSKDAKLSELEVALQEAKQDLAWQLHEDQELMNVKLALDMDITTYSSCWRESRAGESLHIPEKRLDLQCISHHRPSQAEVMLCKTLAGFTGPKPFLLPDASPGGRGRGHGVGLGATSRGEAQGPAAHAGSQAKASSKQSTGAGIATSATGADHS
uniref:IF rod domain-containing protein n=1 Tax=Nothoprocta perdicaria TaxID=30464 RepID=A0A8C6YMB5_NOTPE